MFKRSTSTRVHSEQRRRTERHTVWTVTNGISLMECSNRWTQDFSMPISWEHCLNDFFGDRAETCMTASALSLSVELLFLPHRPLNTSCTVPSTSNLSRIHVIVTLVGGGVPNSNVIELQQHSPFSNNTSLTTYVHRMIISPPCFLNTWWMINVFLRFSSAFWIMHNKLVFLTHFVAEK